MSHILSAQTLTLIPYSPAPAPAKKLCHLSFPLRRSTRRLSSAFTAPLRCSGDGGVLVADLEEKDWSFLEPDATESGEDLDSKVCRIVTAGEVRPESKVLAALPTVNFIDRVVEFAPCELLVSIHESLFVLALIKENHDRVRCWQGGIEVVPKKFGPFDVVFVCYFPGMRVSVHQLFGLLVARCSAGGRVVLSFARGRECVKRHREQYPDVTTLDLPDRKSVEKAAKKHSFHITEFTDEPNFYLAVLKYVK